MLSAETLAKNTIEEHFINGCVSHLAAASFKEGTSPVPFDRHHLSLGPSVPPGGALLPEPPSMPECWGSGYARPSGRGHNSRKVGLRLCWEARGLTRASWKNGSVLKPNGGPHRTKTIPLRTVLPVPRQDRREHFNMNMNVRRCDLRVD